MRANPVARVALVVEDEWIVRDHIVRELKAHGWTVIEATTGEDALALFDGCEVDVLLTDIQLAGAMNGWEVAHAVRAAIPRLPVIYASGNTPDPSQRSMEACSSTSPTILPTSSPLSTTSSRQSDADISKR